jgi:3-deoxy-D-manno-octulosonic-acid transferase
MFNFAEATRLALAAGAAIQAGDARDAMAQAAALLQDDKRRQAMAGAGIRFCEAHRGAAQRQLATCLALLKG